MGGPDQLYMQSVIHTYGELEFQLFDFSPTRLPCSHRHGRTHLSLSWSLALPDLITANTRFNQAKHYSSFSTHILLHIKKEVSLFYWLWEALV
jgi:hypothetical protein